jgi:hypothetical protein
MISEKKKEIFLLHSVVGDVALKRLANFALRRTTFPDIRRLCEVYAESASQKGLPSLVSWPSLVS